MALTPDQCPSGTTCQEGACLCAGGGPLCNGACPDLTSDPKNCGACGNTVSFVMGRVLQLLTPYSVHPVPVSQEPVHAQVRNHFATEPAQILHPTLRIVGHVEIQ